MLACMCRLPQNLNTENLEEYIGYELPAKFLEVDEVRLHHAVQCSNRHERYML